MVIPTSSARKVSESWEEETDDSQEGTTEVVRIGVRNAPQAGLAKRLGIRNRVLWLRYG
jgi:hypothetical protein